MSDSTDLVSHLRVTLGKMEVVLGTITEAIAWTDEAGQVQWSNAAFDHLIGRSRLQLLGKSLVDVLLLQKKGQPLTIDQHPVNQALRYQSKGTDCYEFSTPIQTRVLEVSWDLVDLKEHGASAVLVVRDVSQRQQAETELQQHREHLEELVTERTLKLTAANKQLQREMQERQQAQEALRESEEKLRNLVEQTSNWVWETDKALTFTYVNSKVYELLGYRPEEMLGKSLFEFMSHDQAKRFAAVLKDFLSQKAAFSHLEKVLLHRDKRSIVFETSGVPFFDQQGMLQGYRGIARDITQRKQAEQEICKALAKERELNEMKSQFVSTISHEFRTPLTAVMTAAELLEQIAWDETERQELLQQIQISVDRIIHLLNDVLLISQGEVGKLHFKPIQFDLEKFCRDLVKELGRSAPNKPIIFQLAGDVNWKSVYLDQKLLQHILSNLISNAIKYSPSQTPIGFECTYQDETFIFHIVDCGIGIPSQDQQHLFDLFYRASNVGVISGSGLGLAIVKQCVDLHGGTIAVNSREGCGTAFTVTLPASNQIAE